jgi:hypothetical protein
MLVGNSHNPTTSMINEEKKQQKLEEYLWNVFMKCVIEKLTRRANVRLYLTLLASKWLVVWCLYIYMSYIKL